MTYNAKNNEKINEYYSYLHFPLRVLYICKYVRCTKMNRVDGKVKESHGVDEDTKDTFIYHSYLKAYKPNPQPIGRKDYPQVCGSTKKVRLTLNLLQEIHLY